MEYPILFRSACWASPPSLDTPLAAPPSTCPRLSALLPALDVNHINVPSFQHHERNLNETYFFQADLVTLYVSCLQFLSRDTSPQVRFFFQTFPVIENKASLTSGTGHMHGWLSRRVWPNAFQLADVCLTYRLLQPQREKIVWVRQWFLFRWVYFA